MEDLVDTLIAGISDDLCKRLTVSTMVMQSQMVNLANGNKERQEAAEIKGAEAERKRCVEIMVNKYKWSRRRATNALTPREQ
jgi:hypothetical protein